MVWAATGLVEGRERERERERERRAREATTTGQRTDGRRTDGKRGEKAKAANGWTDGHEADSIGLILPSEPNYPPNGQIYCSDEALTEGS